MSFKNTWGNLRSAERRLVIIVGVLLFIVANAIWVWPRFKDWSATQDRLDAARSKLKKCETAIREGERIKREISKLEREGGGIAGEDQYNQFQRTVQLQAGQSGVNIMGTSKPVSQTNEFFLELIQTYSVQSREEQLVDFLYSLGTGDSMIRARDISLRPDAPHQNLTGNIKLVASFQKVQKSRGRETKPGATTEKPSTSNKS